MAYITDVFCSICGKTKREVTNHDNKCRQCRAEEADKARRTYLAALKGLTLEERIERIEAALYDQNLDNRLSIIETMNARY